MLPYRVSSDRDSLRLVIRPSTFWLRFRLNLQTSRPVLAVAAGLGTLLALSLASIAAMFGAFSDVADAKPWALPLTIFIGVWLVLAGIPLTSLLIRLVLISLKPTPLEQALPSAITMHDNGLVVTERSGQSRSVKWSWFAGARDLGDTLELSLAHDQPMKLFLRRGDGIDLERVRRWLADHRLLR